MDSVYVVNQNNKPFTLKKGTFIGTVSPLDPTSSSNYLNQSVINQVLDNNPNTDSINPIVHQESDYPKKI